jgi:hypothetical protein
LIRETFEVLLQAVQSGTLRVELEGTGIADRADEATQTILDALDAGLRAESRETEWYVFYGLDSLVESFIRFRCVFRPKSTLIPLANRHSFRLKSALVPTQIGTRDLG